MPTFQDLNQQNYFKQNPEEDPKRLWYQLLTYLNEEPLITDEDSGEEGSPFNFIQSYSDLPETTIDEQGFFDNIYENLTAALPSDEVLNYWNESVVDSLISFYYNFDKEGIVKNEADFLYEDEDGLIISGLIKDGIDFNNNNNYTTLRPIDIAESDSGNSFVREEDVYHSSIINGITVKKVVNPWVIPWYNIQGFTYKYTRAADLKKSVMSNGENEKFDRYGNRKFNKFLDFTHSHFDHDYSDNFKWLYNRLLMPEYKRRVEIEDLNRNFWTIGQTITALANYILGEGGPYGKTIGNILNEIMQLWENVLFLWGQIGIQSQKKADVHAEIVYISLEELNDELSYDLNLDFNDDTYITQITDADGMVHTKHYMLENSDLLEAVIKYLRKYRLQYADYNVSLFPVIRLNNYKYNYYSRLILLGEYKYCHNWKDLSLDIYDERVSNYVSFENEVSASTIEELTIDNKKLYYTNFYNITPTNFRDYYFCQVEESFFSYTYTPTAGSSLFYLIDIDARDFPEYLYGIVENSDEETYTGGAPLSESIQMQTDSGQLAWGLISLNTDMEIIKETPDDWQPEDFPSGLWSTKLQFYGIDVSKFLLTNKNRNHVSKNDVIFYYKYDITLAENKKYEIIDVRGNVIPEEYKTFKQIQPVDNEFGYYKGELLTTSGNTTKAQFNLIDLGSKLLPPSDFDGDYSKYYGMNYDDKPTINQDVQNDEIALTNYLRNIYDYWCANNTEVFWNTRPTKIQLKSGQWDPDFKERVGYEVSWSGENKNSKAQEFTRSEVYKSYSNKNLVWPDWSENGIENWKRQNQNYLKINESSMTISTILFVEGSRKFNFNQAVGEGYQGEDILAQDGLLHHMWSTTEPDTASSGAAARIPIPKVGIQYVFYPKHASCSRPPNDYYGCPGRVHSVIKRSQNKIVSERDEMPQSREPLSIALKVEDDFRRLPLRYYNNNHEIKDTFETTWPWEYNEGNVYLVMKKQNENNFTAKNWLINHIKYHYEHYAPYFIPKEKNKVDKLRENCSEKTDLEIKFSDGKLGSSVGREKSIDCIDMAQYYEWIYQKLIFSQVYKIAHAEGTTVDEKFLNDVTIEKIVYDEESRYYLPLKEILIGWMKIVYNNQEYEIKINAYIDPMQNSGTDIIFDYRNFSENDKQLIELVRQYESVNKLFMDDNIEGKKKLYDFIGLIDTDYWTGGNKLEISYSDFSNLQPQECYGYFNGHYKNNVIGREESFSETMWLEDRAILCGYEIPRFKEQKILFDAEVNNSYIWEENIENILLANKECYQKDTIEQCIQQLEKMIVPLENENLHTPITLQLIEDPNIQITITDRIFIKNSVNDIIENFVFGPNSKYAHRSIFTYPDYFDNDPRLEYISGTSGHWAEMPAIPKTGVEEDDEYSLWRDDRQKTGANIDELRQGYEVVQVIGDTEAEQIEKYKTHRNEELDNLAMVKAINDDPDTNNIPRGWIYLTNGGE